MLLLALSLAMTAPKDDCSILESWEIDDTKPYSKAGAGLWIGGIAFTAADISSAMATKEAMLDQWVLQLSFTATGNAKFIQAQHCGVGQPIEISIDRKVLSRPMLNEPILGGKAVIVGNWDTREEVEAVARRITG